MEAPTLPLLVERYADFVFRSLRRLGVPASLADHATEQVFVAARQRREAIEPGKERAFLFSVAIEVASLVRRREVNAGQVVASGLVLDDRRARQLLDEVLDAMDVDLRTVFVMFELEELTMAEVASVLGITPDVVASRLRRAREEFRDRAQRLRARLVHRALVTSSRVSSARLAIAGAGGLR